MQNERERREEIGNWVGCLRILFIGGWSLGVRGAYASTRGVLVRMRHDVRHPKPLAANVDTSEYAGSTRVRGAYLGSDR